MKQESIIVFAPHPDDETLGCGGTIIKKLAEGFDVSIVLMTDGRFALRDQGVLSEPSPEEMKDMRKKEFQKATHILGVNKQNLFYLDFEDSTLEANRVPVEKIIQDILEEKRPIEVYFTYFKDSNPDHRATNSIVQDAIMKVGFKVTKWQYSIVQPYARIGIWKDAFCSLFTHKMVHVNISRFLETKKIALYEYSSQLNLIFSNQKRTVLSPFLVKMHLNDYEVFYKV
jgi:LmbE family N-acetylglucosaminyl deacetylase